MLMVCHRYISINLELTSQQSMFFVLCILLFFVSMVQLNNFYYYYDFEKRMYGGKSIEEKKAQIYYGLPYNYSVFCHQYIPGYKNAQLITDLDINQDPGMFIHRLLAYYLYPIDIRKIRQNEPDYLLFFMKENAKDFVPDNFQIIAELSKKSLIAKRK